MIEKEDKNLISPATTPGSVRIDHFLYVPIRKEPPWYKKFPPPFFALTASALQIIIHAFRDEKFEKLLQFEPNNQRQMWRFFTYMLLHGNWFHLMLNVAMQCIFSIALERAQGRTRVPLIYLGGGCLGALGAACIRPDLIIGASAGVYALLLSHISHLLLNYENLKYKIYRSLAVLIIICSDILYGLGHFYFNGFPIISWGAHAFGALAGFVLGLIIYKNGDNSKASNDRKLQALPGLGVFLLLVLLFSVLLINFQIKKCTRSDSEHYKYAC